LRITDIQKALNSSGFVTHIQESASQDIPDQLLVSLGLDDKDRDLTLQIHLNKETAAMSVTSKVTYRFLHFFLAMPFLIEKSHIEESAKLACLINKIATLPGFNLSETDSAMTYHYVHFSLRDEVDHRELDFIVTTILNLLELFLTSFEEVGSGQKTVKEVVESAEAQP